MRTISLLSLILLLSTASVVAQNNNNSDLVTQPVSSRATIVGCLDGAAGTYTLTNFSGASFQLTGSPEQLNAHVGETMQVTGIVTPVVHVPGAISEGTRTEPTLSVISFRRISGVCVDANYLP